MELSTYFQPVSRQAVSYEKDTYMPSLGLRVDTYWEGGEFPEWKSERLALIGVQEGRNSHYNPGCATAPDAIRAKLYALAVPSDDFHCVDLGNIPAGHTPDDTLFALTETLYQLLERDITVVILGGSQALTYAQYRAYEVLGRIVNVATVDSVFDLETQDPINSRTWLNHLIRVQPNYLFNYAHLGYQTYLNGKSKISLMEELQFDAIRLGQLQGDSTFEAEPFMRAADMVSVDVSSLRQSDAPGNANASPHGLYGEELCGLMRYAGMSDKLSSIGFYEVNPDYDIHGQTVSLMAQALWHFLEGFMNRLGDNPYADKTQYKRFLVPINDGGVEITFYKSRRSDRWWFEVPCNEDDRERYRRNLLIPCTYNDYQQAVQNEIPDRWWKFFNRVNL